MNMFPGVDGTRGQLVDGAHRPTFVATSWRSFGRRTVYLEPRHSATAGRVVTIPTASFRAVPHEDIHSQLPALT